MSIGNLDENDKVFILLMDYPNGQHIKIWGRAKYVEANSAVLDAVADPNYGATPERDRVSRRCLGREVPPTHHAAVHGGGASRA